MYFWRTVLSGAPFSVYGNMMQNLFKLFTLIMVSALWLSVSQAAAFTGIDVDGVTVCPAETAAAIPDFKAPSCEDVSKYDIDPQGRMIWVKANLDLTETTGRNGEPLAIYVSGKMSSRVYLNGQLIGQNGTPGLNVSSEIPGLMDATLFPPQSLFRTGDNEVIMLLSAQRGVLKLDSPVHFIGAGAAGDRRLDILGHYWPSLVTLGLFILGLLYFGVMAVIGSSRKTAIVFSLICGFAAAQLVAEVARGLVSYTYPMHDWRLIAIMLFSAGFGLSVTYHVLSTFLKKGVLWGMLGAGALSLGAIIFTVGLDLKAIYSMLLPLGVSLTTTAYWSFQKRSRAFGYFLILLIFIAAIFAFPSMFLDVIFFFLVAGFLLLLLLEQGVTLAREARQRRIEEARANRLELALEQVRQSDEASELSVKSAGKMERISTANIVQCRGAGGYSEIILSDGRELLHSATLAEMEDALPATFIRVHRSHLVNTSFIKTLNRDTSGTGTLILSDGAEVAVSRRIMPSVRQALG
jgi:hypothetical protein